MNQTVNSSSEPSWFGLAKNKTLAFEVATVLRVESVFFNLCLLLLMLQLKLDKKMYSYFKLKTLAKSCGYILLIICHDELIVPIIQFPAAYVYNSNCSETWDLLKVNVLPIASKVLINLSMMIEIPMIYDRICMLKNKQNWFTRLKVRYTFCALIAFCAISFLPESFTVETDCVNGNQTLVNMTPFGRSDHYKYFFYISGAFKLIFVFLYLVIFIRVVYYYKRSPPGLSDEHCLTKMVIAVGTLNIFGVMTQTINIISGIICRFLKIQFLGSPANEVLNIASYLLNGNTVLAAFYFDQHINKFLKKCSRKICGIWKC